MHMEHAVLLVQNLGYPNHKHIAPYSSAQALLVHVHRFFFRSLLSAVA
jgi:hypothetical protein